MWVYQNISWRCRGDVNTNEMLVMEVGLKGYVFTYYSASEAVKTTGVIFIWKTFWGSFEIDSKRTPKSLRDHPTTPQDGFI